LGKADCRFRFGVRIDLPGGLPVSAKKVRSTVMKLLNGKIGLMLRISAAVTALLLGQQAMAAGTTAGFDILNEAKVNYEVGSVAQPEETASVTFKVDRRVDFTLVPIDTNLEDISPGEQDAWVDFTLTNTSNADLDFALALAHMTGGAVGSGTDNVDLDNIQFAVSPDRVADADPTQTDPQFVDTLLADQSIRIRAWGDANLVLNLVDADVSGVQLTATAREPGSSAAGVIDYTVPDGILTMESVAADAGNDGVEAAIDGFLVTAASLAITKGYTVDGGGPAIPGATIEYTITIVNSGSADATGVAISDDLVDELDLELLTYDGSTSDAEIINDSATSYCEFLTTAGSDCERSAVLQGAVATFRNLTLTAPVSPATSTTLTVKFRAKIR
jgi:uncharacterized repeat protein (TIGR01451 family)